MQEVFLRLYRQLRGGRQVEQVRLWVFRVAHNLAFDEHYRRASLESLDAPAWQGMRESVPDRQPDPEQSLIEQERFKRLLAALPQLGQRLQALEQKIAR